MEAPVNLRVAQDPYPHLRDDQGCVLARDYQHSAKLEFILEAVRLLADARRTKVVRRWGFKSSTQLPLFMVWDEYWYEGEVVHGAVVFNSLDWIGI